MPLLQNVSPHHLDKKLRFSTQRVLLGALVLGASLLAIPEDVIAQVDGQVVYCLLYTSPSPRDATLSRMPSSA